MISRAANDWLKHGERGASSEAIFGKMTGISVGQNHGFRNNPADPSDFRRCEMLLRVVPEFRDRLPEMSSVSPVWAKLVEHWAEIVELMNSEVPGVFDNTWVRGKASKTYELMNSLGC